MNEHLAFMSSAVLCPFFIPKEDVGVAGSDEDECDFDGWRE